MRLPESVVFTDGSIRRPEDGIYLHGYSNTGEHVLVDIRQRNIPDLEWAGRLFFNRELVEMRSETESAVIALLAIAEFTDELRNDNDYIPGPKFGRKVLEKIRNAIVQYVLSDEYVDIGTNGVEKKILPW